MDQWRDFACFSVIHRIPLVTRAVGPEDREMDRDRGREHTHTQLHVWSDYINTCQKKVWKIVFCRSYLGYL